MPAKERKDKNSIAAQVETFESVDSVIVSPIPLREDAQAYYDGIIKARETDTWSDNDRLIAANLSKTYAAIDELWNDIQVEGYVIENQRGTPISNPKLTALNNMTSAMQALNKTLGLSASQRGLSGAKQASRNQADGEARKIVDKAKKSALLA